MRKAHPLADDVPPPDGVLNPAGSTAYRPARAARLLYAVYALSMRWSRSSYDLTYRWGTLRDPLSVGINLLFLFPLYGVSDVCIITLAIAKVSTNRG